MAVVAGVPPVLCLSNFTPLQLAPRLAPCGGLAVAQPRHGPSWSLLPAFPQFFLSPISLPASLPPAWPRVACSLWRNLGPARHGRCCRLATSRAAFLAAVLTTYTTFPGCDNFEVCMKGLPSFDAPPSSQSTYWPNNTASPSARGSGTPSSIYMRPQFHTPAAGTQAVRRPRGTHHRTGAKGGGSRLDALSTSCRW